jgi:hypothetical protein
MFIGVCLLYLLEKITASLPHVLDRIPSGLCHGVLGEELHHLHVLRHEGCCSVVWGEGVFTW